MSGIAVVRLDQIVPVRDLLLFDEIYVLNLDEQMEQLAGLDLANAVYLLDQGILRPAPSTLGDLGVTDRTLICQNEVWASRPTTVHLTPSRYLRVLRYTWRI